MHLRWSLLLACGSMAAGRAMFLLVTVTGESMAPTLQPGDRLLAVRWLRLPARLLRGRVVVVRLPPRVHIPNGAPVVIKRVIAVRANALWLEGDSVHSVDSRHFGWVDGSCVNALVLTRLRPGAV